MDNTYPKGYTILKQGLLVQNFVISLYANEKMVFDYFSIEILFYASMAQGKGNLRQKTKWMNFGTYSSFIHVEWGM